MGFNSAILQDVNYLEQELKNIGSVDFYNKNVKGIDSFRGNIDSIEFIEKFIIEYNETDNKFYTIIN